MTSPTGAPDTILRAMRSGAEEFITQPFNWAEVLTRVAKTQAPDADYELLQSQFNESEIAYLTLLIGAINLWTRVQIGLRAVHPVEQPAVAAA